MKILYLSIVITGIVFGLAICYPTSASANLVPGFSIVPDQNYTDPITHYLSTKEGHPHIVISRDYEFTLPMTLKSANDSLPTSYSFLVTNDTNFTTKVILPEISIHVVPDHFIIRHGGNQKFDIVIKTGKNTPSGVYQPNLVILWNNNVTLSREVTSIPFQVGKWNWGSLERQMESGISAKNVVCESNQHIVVIKSEDGSPACVKPDTAQILVKRGWAKSLETAGIFVTLTEGQREGPLLLQKIFSDSIQGLDFREYPLATNVGNPITLHLGDSASNGCTVDLTLVKISNGTATFLKKENFTRLCPICLSENTVIDTTNSSINVKELKTGMMVLTQDSYGHKQTGVILKVGRTMVPPHHMMIHVVLDDKRELYVSPNHPTTDGRFFGELLAGDYLDGSKIKSVEQVPYNGTYTYDLLPSGQTGFYWANGILVASTLK